ncbi:hypothetical protein [Natrialba sp. INN-245]|uniref:hypothetical protein n=1 Tax=Natrialba sp. INN-245 TaxID=2690967 RepID=UPI00131178CB|nr:hypothetical protein [Natrialba sp. INN-245]MWV38768.1 hypothetical protein [Natrialba sp. INN-245]
MVGIAGIAGCLGDDDGTNGGGNANGGTDTSDPAGDGTTQTEAESAGEGGGESIRLEAEDGWTDPHDGVEIPDDPGTAIMTVGDETVELSGIASGGELSEGDVSATGAQRFEIQGTFRGGQYRDYGLEVNVTRVIGVEDTMGQWAESDSFGFTRDDGIRLGNVIYRLYEDGRLADDEIAGELDGRRFTDEPFVHIDRDGILTVVEEIDSHEDESLNGRFEFGARLPDGWNEM